MAVKDKQLGRSKGGLLIFVNKTIKGKLIDKNDWWICFELNSGKELLIIIFVYFNPTYDISVYLNGLKELIFDIYNTYSNPRIITFGDFNARIGELNSFCDKFDSSLFENTPFNAARKSLDEILNHRGNQLVSSMSL